MFMMLYFQMQINPAASEAIVLALGQSSQPYKTCQFILGQSLYNNLYAIVYLILKLQLE